MFCWLLSIIVIEYLTQSTSGASRNLVYLLSKYDSWVAWSWVAGPTARPQQISNHTIGVFGAGAPITALPPLKPYPWKYHCLLKQRYQQWTKYTTSFPNPRFNSLSHCPVLPLPMSLSFYKLPSDPSWHPSWQTRSYTNITVPPISSCSRPFPGPLPATI